MADDIKRTNSEDAMLGRLDERTMNLATSLRDLQISHENAHKAITLSMERVQIANKVETDKVVAVIEKHLIDDDVRFDKHHERISALETWPPYFLGIIATLGVVLGGIMWWLK
jgi:hypothetical protein